MTTSFLTPILTRHAAEIEEAIAQAAADINARLLGIGAEPTAVQPNREPPAPSKKRTPEELSRVTEIVYRVIAKHPGERIEQLAERVGMTTKEMNLPIRKLRAEKRISVKGSKRATTYSAKG